MSNNALAETAVVYGLDRPTAEDLHNSVRTVYGGAEEGAWERLLVRAGGSRVTEPTAERLIAAAQDSGDPILSLCGRAQHIRLVAYERLGAVRDAVATAR